MRRMKRCMGLLVGLGVVTQIALAQSPPTNAATDPVQQRLKSLEESLNYLKHDLAKAVTDQQWFTRMADIAVVDKVRFTGPPSRITNNATAQDAGLELLIPAYTFLPRSVATNSRLPLLVFVHGGIHGDFEPTSYFSV